VGSFEGGEGMVRRVRRPLQPLCVALAGASKVVKWVTSSPAAPLKQSFVVEMGNEEAVLRVARPCKPWAVMALELRRFKTTSKGS
jgi:hypothetical protein